jgi:hypothetical protein
MYWFVFVHFSQRFGFYLNFDSLSRIVGLLALCWIGVCSCCSVWLPRKWKGKVFWGRVENNVIWVVEFIALVTFLHFSRQPNREGCYLDEFPSPIGLKTCDLGG